MSKSVSKTKYLHLILGGTIKAATSSLFDRISEHPQVCGSKVKETWFFSMIYSGDLEQDSKEYASYFTPQDEHRVLFEASPEYLTYKENVAPRIKRLVPDARLLFVLRNPVDRLYSYFNFARAKLQLPQDMSFEKFVECCENFDRNRISAADAGIALKHLRALEIGNYSGYLENFYREFEARNIKVIFYDDFENHPQQILTEIFDFIGVAPSFCGAKTVSRSNVTYSSRIKIFHRLALKANLLLEPRLRRYPGLKRRLTRIYRFLNQEGQGYPPLRNDTRDKLTEYYAPSNALLKKLLRDQKLPGWIN